MENIFVNLFKRLLNKLAFILPGGDNARPRLQKLRGVIIGKNVWIAQYVYFDELYPEKITVAENCTIGLRVSIITHLHWGEKSSKGYSAPVSIEKDVFIGPYCVILPGVNIGEGSVIKAGTVVSRNVPPHTYWGESPARPLAQVTIPLTRDHTFDEFRYGLRRIDEKDGATHFPPE